jgi:hypothetical protein
MIRGDRRHLPSHARSCDPNASNWRDIAVGAAVTPHPHRPTAGLMKASERLVGHRGPVGRGSRL